MAVSDYTGEHSPEDVVCTGGGQTEAASFKEESAVTTDNQGQFTNEITVASTELQSDSIAVDTFDDVISLESLFAENADENDVVSELAAAQPSRRRINLLDLPEEVLLQISREMVNNDLFHYIHYEYAQVFSPTRQLVAPMMDAPRLCRLSKLFLRLCSANLGIQLAMLRQQNGYFDVNLFGHIVPITAPHIPGNIDAAFVRQFHIEFGTTERPR